MRLRAPVAAVVAVSLLGGCLLVLSRNKEHFVAALGQNYVYEPKKEVPDSSKNSIKHNKDTVFRVRKENAVLPAKPEIRQKDSFIQKDAIVLPSKDDMLKLAQPELATMYHGYINSLQVFCSKITRMGKLDDGGWDICDDLAYRPGQHCLVYSFGINFDFSFDDAIVRKYNCEVHSFDPSMRRPDHKHGKNVMFHAAGLSKDNKPSRGKLWKMRTLKQFLEELGHLNRTIDVLKIDIEEWEWLALPEMLKSGVMSQVRQFDVELHITLKAEPNKNKYFLGLSILKDLYDAGFRIFWTHRNLYCKFNSRVGSVARSGCHEVSFINVNFKPKT